MNPEIDITVVIPALNEEQQIGKTLKRLMEVERLETIVVDGGSVDATVSEARAHGARIISSAAGRARQMNAGAAVARGDVLLFLHADTQLPPDFADSILTLSADHSVSAGAFSLQIDAPGMMYRLIERGVEMRCRWLQLPYGDQAIFLRRSQFEVVGGFAELAAMEDFDLMRRLKRLPGGGCVQILDQHVLTSSRRWRRQGPLRTVLINQLAIAAYLLGFPTTAIARLLRGRTDGQRAAPCQQEHTGAQFRSIGIDVPAPEGTDHASIGR